MLTETLLDRADRTPGAVAYEAVDPFGAVTTLTCAQLASRALLLARRLDAVGDGPVLLAYPAGLDYVVAIYAGFLAGRAIIPAFPPGLSPRADRTRLAGIVADAAPPAVVAPRRFDEIDVPTVLSVPDADGDAPGPRRGAAELAVVQYTSGSTSRPRGVLVRHDNLNANIAAIVERFRVDADSRSVTWLPPYHDMGLVGGLLTPMAAGIPVRIIEPVDFLKDPLWWLRQIGETGATHSGGPNFGYDLCLRRLSGDAAVADLDLSRWRVAFSGGETVRHRTLAEFSKAFAPNGFRPEALLPCYGLAEATLIVSAGHWSGPSAASTGPVSCGAPVRGQDLAIVDPERGTAVADGAEGEIWIAGPNVTPGYLSGDSGDLFGELDGRRHLRTGDLGYLRDGELYVSGRAKDVLVYRGVNHHAVDVEAAASDAAGRAGRTAAAFLIESGTPGSGDTEPLPVLAVEVHDIRTEAVATAIRAAVLAATGLQPALVALVPAHSLPRTSSGKVRRATARKLFLRGVFDEILIGDEAALAALADLRAAAVATAELTTLICGVVAGVCDLDSCLPTDRLVDLGVDSVRAGEAAAVLERALGLRVPLMALISTPTPKGAAETLVTGWLTEGRPAGLLRDRVLGAASGTGVG
ncbi:non-ribosomal peptide synthetase [Nocardia sp. BMG111209]|uniref:non-ribosomal peptide synthetase n=1 Tax=Nocardia sp. BMG111209 TaxID=1160137 RepID=UPI00036F54F0|nr:non-ribosomal peptide synthetase [Nocardia sp. BMG111209]